MESSDKYPEMKEAVFEHLQNSDLRDIIKVKEEEIVYSGNIEKVLKLEGRIKKERDLEAQEFREILFDIIAEKWGNERATKFLADNFSVEIGVAEGDKFEGLEAFDVDGKKVNIIHEGGKVLMIDFWATWCGYCQKPMQENIDLMTKNTNLKDKNIEIIGISSDEDISKWKVHINKKKWTGIPQYVKPGVLKVVGIKGIPCIIIVNTKGFITYFGHPNSIKLEESLLALADDKKIIKTNSREGDEEEKGQNNWWNELDADTKKEIVSEANNSLKESGVINGKFCVRTQFVLDKETYRTKPLKTSPIFYGDVTQFEYDTIQTCATILQTTYNFNGFSFNLKIMKIGQDVDF